MAATSPSAPVIELSGIRHGFADGLRPREVLRGIDLSVEAGEFVAITGPSGAGKSTLLRIAAALLRPDHGTVTVHGVDIYAASARYRSRLRRREMGFVFQDNNLLDILSAVENVSLPLELDGVSPSRAADRAREALARVGLAEQADAFPPQLSGGERQRVAIARAVVGERSVVLADEPTGALDSVTGASIISVLAELATSAGVTVLLVTHNEDQAKRASRTVHIADGRL